MRGKHSKVKEIIRIVKEKNNEDMKSKSCNVKNIRETCEKDLGRFCVILDDMEKERGEVKNNFNVFDLKTGCN